jgi:acetyl-CoA synthase
MEKGICLDKQKGCYMGTDKLARYLSEQNITRVNLHSIREYPHPTTALAECIAWYVDELDSILIISHDYHGRSPDGKTFNMLLARITGQQTPGIVGISERYILSSRFMQAEGGLARVGWMNSELKQRLGIRVDAIATEKDCTNLAGLKSHLATWRH